MEEETKTIGAVERSFEIIEKLEEFGSMGVSELAGELSTSKSTVYTHLNTLLQNGYVVKESDGLYRLSCQFLRIGGMVRNRIPLFHQAKDEVDRLAGETGERTNLVIEEQGWTTCIYSVNPENSTDLSMSLGERRYLHATASGKAILAHFPSDRVAEIVERHGLPAFTDQTITSREQLERELETIRETGIAIDDEENIEGLCCIGAPIVVEDTVLGSISISGPARRFNDQTRSEALREAVRDAANVVQIDCILPQTSPDPRNR